jgi:hypothetical protein
MRRSLRAPSHTGRELLHAQGFDRYDVYRRHEAEAKRKEIAILRRSFPDSTIDVTSTVRWHDKSLPDKEARVQITPDGLLIATRDRRARP